MGALLALIPVRDWFYGALTIAAGLFAWHIYDKYEAAVKYAADLRAESVRIVDASEAALKATNADYEAKLKAAQEAQDVALQEANNQSAGLASRLRNALAHSGQCPVLQGSAPAPTSGAAGTGGAGELIQAVAALAAAAAHDTVVCQTERLERDALTGK